MRILSFDVGLRNLGVAIIRSPAGFTIPPGAPDPVAYAVTKGWYIEYVDCIDVTGGSATNVKRLSIVDQARALCAAVHDIETFHLPMSGKPDIVVIEHQHGANNLMRAVAMCILGALMTTQEGADFRSISGGHKLKVCDVVGVSIGTGIRKDVAAFSLRDKYADNKKRAVLATAKLLELSTFAVPASDAEKLKDPNAADAFLQAVYVMWQCHLPSRAKKSAVGKRPRCQLATSVGPLPTVQEVPEDDSGDEGDDCGVPELLTGCGSGAGHDEVSYMVSDDDDDYEVMKACV